MTLTRVVEERVDGDDPGGARAVDASGMKPVARERPCRRVGASASVRAEVRSVRRDEHRLTAVCLDDARRLAEQEHGGRSDDGRDERDDGNDPGTHWHPTVATAFGSGAVWSVVYLDNYDEGNDTRKTVRPGLESRSISPSITSASSRAMASPSPL